MSILTIVLSVLLGLAFLAAGSGKLRNGPSPMTDTLRALGVGPSLQRTIGVLELLGGAGVAFGLLVPPLGVIAAVGLAALMVGAVGYHVKARDGAKETTGSAVLLVVSGAVAALQLASL